MSGADDLVRRPGAAEATAEFIAHYHSERNHLGLDNALIVPNPGHAVAEGNVQRSEGLGGLLNHYYREAA